MIYPRFIREGDTIGVTACSAGKSEELDAVRMDNAATQLKNAGYTVIETDNCRKCHRGRSSDAKTRINELEELLYNEQISYILMCSGGDYLVEIIDLLNFNLIQQKKKWLQGYSDPTGLLYTVTVNTELATIYGNNYGDFGMEEWHSSIRDNISFLEGSWDYEKGFIQKSYTKYQDGFLEKRTGLEGYDLSADVCWMNISGGKDIKAEGRMLGGCLDVLINLVGTKFDKTLEFIEKYKDDGIIWYIESFDLNSERLYLGLWTLKQAGWFDTVKAFLFGRPTFFSSGYDITYEETVLSVIKDIGAPIVLDACFGHKPPRLTIVNGAFGKLCSSKGRGSLLQRFI